MSLDILHDFEQYAAGNLSLCEELDLFQRLVDTGLAWKFGDSTAATANQLLMRGKLTMSDETPQEIRKAIAHRQSAIQCFMRKGEEENGHER